MALVRAHVLVCTGTGCVSSGSKKVIAKLEEELKANSLDKEVKIVETGCQGFCEQGPLVIIYPEGTFYTHVQESDVPEIVSEHLIKGRIVGRLLFKEPLTAQSVPDYADIDFYKKQHRLVLKNCGQINPDSIEEYIGADGYEGLAKVLLTMTPEQVVEEMKKTGLRGRGGGGFPTGMKWGFCQKSPGPKKYIICNADEGDPGAFMDRSLLEGDPHAILEGMIIGAYAIGADEGYIYCRAEYPLAIKRLKQAIAQAEEAGLLGENILGTDFNCTIHIKEGAGAFVCGEETALMASIEGKRGMPRPRPAFPAGTGRWEKPSNINNVETFANVPYIFRVGAEEYAKLGTEKSKGTKVFALTGKINNTGLAEVPMGITMRELICDIGGGLHGGKKFTAAQSGGPSGGCIPEQLLDTPVDYDSLIAAGAMMGSGGLVVMDEETCMVDVAKFFLNFTQSESCGKCTPCREGTKRMLEMLEKITDGKGEDGDIEKLEKLASSIKAGALCALGQTAPNPILSTLRYFRDEYEAHIKEKRCPAGACHHLLTYKITDACKGCSLCAKNCPVNAISGEPKQKYVIDAAKCIKCGACLTKCPFKAIVRG
ncbi:MAG: NADH-quinone oxidoreductase subunit NuoF [Cloacibacillus porcorum]|nr:NADH-quinone oxidoreductase subunit NuoF [Cloacibacillus porcorum]